VACGLLCWPLRQHHQLLQDMLRQRLQVFVADVPCRQQLQHLLHHWVVCLQLLLRVQGPSPCLP
jgi:hypothetical protein